jgi:hypothetical protein
MSITYDLQVETPESLVDIMRYSGLLSGTSWKEGTLPPARATVDADLELVVVRGSERLSRTREYIQEEYGLDARIDITFWLDRGRWFEALRQMLQVVGEILEKHPGRAILLHNGEVVELRKEGSRVQVVDVITNEEDLRATLQRPGLELEIIAAPELPNKPSGP